MKLYDYSLFYKIKKYGGIRNIIGKNGFDFWVALITTASFLVAVSAIPAPIYAEARSDGSV